MEHTYMVIDYFDGTSEIKKVTNQIEKDICFTFTIILTDIEEKNIREEIERGKTAKDILGYYQWK